MTPTPEKLKPAEKTPAEIAAELDRKAQVLEVEGKASDAQRKRGVAEKIRGLKTELELGSLQKTLPFHEAKDIEDARGNSTSTHPEVLATAAVGTAGVVAAIDKLDGSMEKTGLGKLGIKESIKEWITEELTEELDKDAGFLDKIIHKIKMMFLVPFAKMFGVDVTKKKGEGKEGNGKDGGVTMEGEKGGKIEGTNEDINKKYLIASIGLTEISSEVAQQGGLSKIFPLKNIQEMKLQDIKVYAGNLQGFRTFAGLKNDISDAAILAFLSIFTDTKNPSYKILVSSYEKTAQGKTVSNATILDIISHIGSDINFLKILKGINVADYENSIAEATRRLFIHDEKTGDISGDLVEKAYKLGFSKNLLLILFSSRDAVFTDKRSFDSLYDNPALTAEDKKTLDKFGVFSEGFKTSIFTDTRLNLGNGEIMKSKAEINMGSMLKSYILTGGKVNLDEMSTIEKIGAYTAFFMISAKTPETAGGVTGSIFNFENLVKCYQKTPDIFNQIPEDVQTTISGIFSFEVIWDKIKGYMGDTGKYTKEFFQKSPGLTAILILFFIVGPIFSPRKSLVDMMKHRK